MTDSLISKPADAAYLDRKDPIVRIEVPAGDAYLELFPDAAPKHVERILLLASEGFYDGILFHRIVPNFVAQVGDPKTKKGLDVPGAGSGGSTYPNLPLEVNRAYKNVRGSLAAARTNEPNSANSQFYIVLKDAPHLDMQYTVFGRVLDDGMTIVDQIKRGDALKMVIVKR